MKRALLTHSNYDSPELPSWVWLVQRIRPYSYGMQEDMQLRIVEVVSRVRRWIISLESVRISKLQDKLVQYSQNRREFENMQGTNEKNAEWVETKIS